MDYIQFIQLQTTMTMLFLGIIVLCVIRIALQNKKVFRMLSIVVLIIPFSIMMISMSILDYLRH
ncbi:hypothetical protein D8865_09025 [Streptococcus mitis]|uniref:Uncharacterized protein n=1 Tax=Streptococcus mitis TaxID=28037 RepID=A0A3R9IME4_STRMT|nr:hypothetical protein D8865_09025 [Streptococcus mitis]